MRKNLIKKNDSDFQTVSVREYPVVNAIPWEAALLTIFDTIPAQ
jgi:hypothetical protein